MKLTPKKLCSILDISRSLRSKSTLKRIEIKNPKSTTILRKHINGTELISPTIKEIIKEEKDQTFKRQGYYNKPFKKRNFFNSYSNYNSDFSGAFQLPQTLQKLSNNQFFRKREEDSLQAPNNYQPIYPRNSHGRGGRCNFRGRGKYWIEFGVGVGKRPYLEGDVLQYYGILSMATVSNPSSREILEREPKIRRISWFKERTSNYETKDSRRIKEWCFPRNR
jgi:hypothetical protein